MENPTSTSKKNIVTVEIDAKVYSNLKQAAEIVALSGITVPASRLMTALINAEIGSKSPPQLAKTFMRSLVSCFKEIQATTVDEEDD